ncbi:MAG: peptidyl-prolyl cis-trans isomerase [Eubacterium sp.]|nr:peptidyl-prolyl cis-trans isomerase [Eubacterium sp.]
MNSAKKILKNNGDGMQSSVKQSKGISKNMVLLIVGILLVAVLGGGVCWVNLRPRAILTVEGKDKDGKTVTHTVNYPEALYDIYQAEAMPNMYAMYNMSFDWEDTAEDGETYSSTYKKQIMQTLKKREILYMCAQKQGLSLTDEEKKAVQEDVKNARKNMTDKQKKMKGLDEATLTTVMEKDKLGEKYKDSVIATLNIDEDALKKTVDKKSYRQYTLQYYVFAKTETDSEGNSKDKDAKTIAQGKKDMEELQKKAAKAKDFTKNVMTDKNDDKIDDNNKAISYSTKDLVETDEDFLDKKTLKKVKTMKNGEVSDVLETKDGYYVIKMVNNNDPEAYNNQCESVISQEKETQFDATYKNTIKAEYTATAQSYWKGRVNIGYLTTDDTQQ